MADIDFGKVAYPYITEDLLCDDADYRGVNERRMVVLHALNEIRRIFVTAAASQHAYVPSNIVNFSPLTL